MENIVNLTPHTLNILLTDASLAIPPSGKIARVSMVREPVEPVITPCGAVIPCATVTYGEVTGLPTRERGTVYVVSGLVMTALDGVREDVFSPGEAVRDEEGRVIGCKSFSR